MNLDDWVTALILIAVFYLLFFIGKLVNDLLHREYRLSYELTERDNPALALAVAGYYFGLVMAIGGALAGPSNGITEDLIDLGIYGLLSILLLNISWFICDRLILYRFRLSDELIRDQNQGSGAVSAGVSIASGLIIFGSVTGEGGNIRTAVAFWAVGQLFLILAAFVYNRVTPYSVHDQIEQDNVAAGVSFAGALIAIGIVVGLAAERDFESWAEDFPAFITVALSGLVMLPLVRFLTDRILLPAVRLSDEIAAQETPNVGAAYIEALSYIGAAFVICWCV
ncbi:DUF350 domain-containing protein [Desulfonema ishimotonii]|uniref:DUF350 domain-containing protein n=2 Tax=Desulfonema ishimotonii TaxID=45657 RepID=A0A401FRL8_9BACT|nr:DUF350 domain-containing protein [Desulfonema ishimotonii]